jgi:hypothetical protein
VESNNNHNTISERFWGTANRNGDTPTTSFYDGKENLIRGVHFDDSLGQREFAEDVPTASYNPGSVVSVFYSGFQT